MAPYMRIGYTHYLLCYMLHVSYYSGAHAKSDRKNRYSAKKIPDNKTIFSLSNMDVNQEKRQLPQKMESSDQAGDVHPVLREKWEQQFRFVDIDNDGFWTKKDLDIVRDNLIKDTKMTPEKHEQVMQMAHDIWVKYYGLDLNGTMSCEQFVMKMQRMLQQGTLADILTKSRTVMFSCMDFNGDNHIDLNEFKIYSNAVDKADMPHIDRAFHLIDKNNDGKITLSEYIDAYISYNTDPNIPLKDFPLYGLPPEKKIDH